MDQNNDTEIIEHENIRPWVRYWARYIDMYFFLMLIMILQKLLFPTQQLDIYIVAYGIYFIWMLLEAQLMATWGTTPGKWLLKTKVLDKDNNKLTLKTALIRGFLVWSLGMAMATIFSNVAEAFAYVSLKKNGITMWDKYCNCNVTHEKFGPERIPLIIVTIVIPLFIFEMI